MNFVKNDHVIYVGHGFSFLAFIFSWGWLLAKGLWGYGIVFMLIQLPLYVYAFAGNAFLPTVSEKLINLTQTYLLLPNALLLLTHLMIGFKGNQWKQAMLKRKGYKLMK